VDGNKLKVRDLNEKIYNNDKSTPNVQGCTTFRVVSFCQLFLNFLCRLFIIFALVSLFMFSLSHSFFKVDCAMPVISCLSQPFNVYFNHFIFCQPFSCFVSHFILFQPFYVVSVISYCFSHFIYFVSHFFADIFFLCVACLLP
jgi:hypothetical protein